MRIAEVNDLASVATELTKALRARGHDVRYFGLRLVGGGLPAAIKPAVAPIRAAELVGLARKLRAGHFDVLHIHYAYLGVLGIVARRPFILHCHGADVWAMTPTSGWLAKRSLRLAAHVYYSTPDLAAHVLPWRRDAEYLPNPVDVDVFRPLAPAGEQGGVYIACALDDLKGAPAILEACRQLNETRPDIRLTAIGGGEHTAAFAALPNVSILPRQERADLPALIAQHGVVIGQVNLGAVGMAEMEALACERPVVCSYTYAGFYPEEPPFVQAADGGAIAAAVERLVDDAEVRQRLGREGRAWVVRYHALEAMADRVEAVAVRIAGGRGTACGRAS